ncbi:MAG: glycosyltransferase family 39 protein [Betaproteobacteria bacterium]
MPAAWHKLNVSRWFLMVVRRDSFSLLMVVLALLVFRVWFSIVLPMTGDEAYFVFWGEHSAGGYYDHPPMVGWWLSGLLQLSRSEWVLRLPSLLLPLLLAAGGWWLVRPHGAERARLAALLVLLQPVNVWNVLITTDTPVILFSMLSMLAYVAALRASRTVTAVAWQGVAGALLGLAFLGKYFAALLGIAYLLHTVLIRRDERRWVGFLVLLIAALPAPIYNLWWNSNNCWVNILFNFINRHDGAGLTWKNPALYLVSLLYLATPWVLLELLRQRRYIQDAMRRKSDAGAVFWLLLVPLLLFALMSLWRPIGLHWMVSFMPLFAVLAAMVLPQVSLDRLVKWSAVFAGVHALGFVIVLALPLQTWEKTRLYDGIVLTVRSADLLAKLEPYAGEYLFAMEGYSPAATLAYNANRRFAVFGEGSIYARQDDAITDWREQNGRKVLILSKSEPRSEDYAAYFRRVEILPFELYGAHYWIVLGQGFNYPVYHDRVLTRIRERFYRIPSWLPQQGCGFCERYFPEDK